MKNLLLLIVLLIGLSTSAQFSRVYLSDKGESEMLFSEPWKFLSARAIERRAKADIAIEFNDLPLSNDYKSTVRKRGVVIEAQSKWLNYIVVHNEDLVKIIDLDFIERVEKINSNYYSNLCESASSVADFNYGESLNQLAMLRGDVLHGLGYTGDGMQIAVIDGGFFSAEPGGSSVFDSLWLNNQIISTYSFVNKDTNVFAVGSHGAKVLSIMGSRVDSALIGSAPLADYYLLQSENEISETTIEMDYWLMAAEYADSAGADVINSSLGYSTFDGGIGDYTVSDMDGNTTIVTKAADMAASKGILVVVSAGNSGLNDWGRLTAPSDGDSVLSVGAVRNNGIPAGFSGRGPSADGRVKPNVAAQGVSTVYGNSNSSVSTGNGTSFSSPIIAGLSACLWQANSSLSNMEILRIIEKSSHQYFAPDVFMGFGIPNFEASFYSIGLQEENRESAIGIYPNPTSDRFKINTEDSLKRISLRDYNGRIIKEWNGAQETYNIEGLARSNYFVVVEFENFIRVVPIQITK